MQSVTSRIWTRVAISISYDYNHYTTGTSVVAWLPVWKESWKRNAINLFYLSSKSSLSQINSPSIYFLICGGAFSLTVIVVGNGIGDPSVDYSYRLSEVYSDLIFCLVWFGLVWFYGISTIVGYLKAIPFYAYILNKYDL